MKTEAGDKVRLKARSHPGSRGIVEATRDGKLLVRLEDSGQRVLVVPEEVTNLSLAARKAWVSMPDRHVGRPKGMRFCDRISVTLRIDRDLWEQFRLKESTGFIEDRTATINSWLREKLAELEQVERQS
ncbi:MAG: hypothetical protein HYZ72_12870 [Deltaproteobacteria bacterium]|nr:hypothetical protein [Deltaproteobacteria bacterium]